jgi:hypothetical protein
VLKNNSVKKWEWKNLCAKLQFSRFSNWTSVADHKFLYRSVFPIFSGKFILYFSSKDICSTLDLMMTNAIAWSEFYNMDHCKNRNTVATKLKKQLPVLLIKLNRILVKSGEICDL